MCQSSSIQEEYRSDKESKAYTYDDAVELTGHGRYNYLLLITCSIITNAVALDMFGFGITVAAANCDLQLDLTETGVLASAPFAGVIFAFPWGYYADTRGRRRALLLSTLGGFIFATTSSFSPSWQLMMLLKVIACSFSTISYSLTMTLLGECTGSSNRSKFLFIMNSVNLLSECFSFGLAFLLLPLQFSLPMPVLGLNFRSWRLYSLTLALPMGIGGLMMLFLHESPKFLASRGDNTKALEVLRSIYEWNGGKKGEYQVQHLLTTDNSAVQHKTSFWSSVVMQTVPIFKPPLLWRTLQIFFLMAICSSTNNAFVMWYPTIVNIFFNSLSDGWNTDQKFCTRISTSINMNVIENSTYICDDTISPSTTISGVFYGLFFCVITLISCKFAVHRRFLLIFWLIVSGVSCTLVDIYLPYASFTAFVLLQTATIGVPSLASYCVDLYPTAYRGLVTSLAMMVARLCSLAGVNLVGASITTHCALTFYAWSAFVFSGVVVSLFLPSDKIMNNKYT